jgi:hypothetical protein
MSPDDVPAEWVEAAWRVYDKEGYLVSARVVTLALAAALPLAQAAALEVVAERMRNDVAAWGGNRHVGGPVGAARYIQRIAARLREGSTS